MTKRDYYSRWLDFVFAYPWTGTRQMLAFVTCFSVPLLLTPSIKSQLPGQGKPLSDGIGWVALTALVALCVRAAGRCLLFPYQTHHAQERKIQALYQQLNVRKHLRAHCERIAKLVDEGEQLRNRCAKPRPIPIEEPRQWFGKVEAYVKEHFGSHALTQWRYEDEAYVPRALAPEVPGDNQRLFRTLSFRVRALRTLLETLTDRLHAAPHGEGERV